MNDFGLREALPGLPFKDWWLRYGLDVESGLKLRRRAQSDLFFLCTELLGYKKLVSHAHKEVCDFFVKKAPDNYREPLAQDFETFARNYRGLHDRLLWLPRGGFKSTIDIGDNVQWIITFPDIRINVMTDVLALSQEFVGGTKGHFTLDSNGRPRVMPDGKPSLFQILFPEFCDTAPANYQGNVTPKWITPARKNRQILAPTIRAAGIDAGKTGTHCDISKFDDVLTPESIGTGKSMGANLRSVNKKIALARNLRARYGFTDMIGTPQDSQDYNSLTVQAEKRRAEQGLPPTTEMLIRPAYTKLPGYEDLLPPEIEEHMVNMWFPEELSLQFIKNEWLKPEGRDTVATQLLLDVSLKQMAKFKREDLIKATIPYTIIPRQGTLVIPWDLAYSVKAAADYTVGLPSIIAAGRFYVIDMIRGKFDEDALPRVIALAIYTHRPNRVAIENSQGAKWLKLAIDEELKKLSYEGPQIEWADIGRGTWRRNEVNAGPTVRLLKNGQLFFSTAIPRIDDLYDELEAFPNARHKDDIVSCLNLLCNYFVSEAELTVMQAHDESTNSDDGDLWHERIHNYGRGVQGEEEEPVMEPVLSGYSLLPNVLGDLPE